MLNIKSLFKTFLLSSVALIAFAGNSVLCRLALADQSIDPAGFTIIRLLSGVVMLGPLLYFSNRSTPLGATLASKGSWFAAFMLFAYAVLFSFAYVSIDTATGALILFGSVQLMLIGVNIFKGHKPTVGELAGVALALAGFVYLVLPQLQQPSMVGLVMMSVAGIAWALYTVAGQGSKNALSDTTFNFLRTTPLCLLLLVVSYNSLQISAAGVVLAVASGAITSGLGYAVWYAVLPRITTAQAGVMQLLVPIIAGVGGVVFANESLSWRLVIAGILVLSGILLVIQAKRKSA